MSAGDGETSPVTPAQREKLVMILHPRRVGYLFHYVVGVALFVIGLLFNIMSAAHFLPYQFISWLIGLVGIVTGWLIVAWAELHRRSSWYIITTWNVRVRRGIIWKEKKRVFYDDITDVRTTSDPEERIAQMGDVEVYTAHDGDTPTIVFEDVRYPNGVAEIVRRFVRTMGDPVPWAHIDKSQEPL